MIVADPNYFLKQGGQRGMNSGWEEGLTSPLPCNTPRPPSIASKTFFPSCLPSNLE